MQSFRYALLVPFFLAGPALAQTAQQPGPPPAVRARLEAMSPEERTPRVVHGNAKEEVALPADERARRKGLWEARRLDSGEARIEPVERKLSPVQQATKMRQEKHWNDLTPAEQAKRKAAFRKRHSAQ